MLMPLSIFALMLSRAISFSPMPFSRRHAAAFRFAAFAGYADTRCLPLRHAATLHDMIDAAFLLPCSAPCRQHTRYCRRYAR